MFILQEFRLIQQFSLNPHFIPTKDFDFVRPEDATIGLHGVVTGCLYGTSLRLSLALCGDFVIAAKCVDDGAASVLIDVMCHHHANPELVASCLRSLYYIAEAEHLVMRMVTELDFVRAGCDLVVIGNDSAVSMWLD